MIEELRAGAKVVFAGGLMGTIAQATEKTFIVELAGGVKMEILRSSVQSVIAEDAK
jgi:preprotein translocase YajC subunit